jgi:hypothetical protein
MSSERQPWIKHMLNANPDSSSPESDDQAVDRIVRTGAQGALTLAILATAIVLGMWLAFYALVFMPRSTP